MRLKRRRSLKKGYFAYIVVFDPAAILGRLVTNGVQLLVGGEPTGRSLKAREIPEKLKL